MRENIAPSEKVNMIGFQVSTYQLDMVQGLDKLFHVAQVIGKNFEQKKNTSHPYVLFEAGKSWTCTE